MTDFVLNGNEYSLRTALNASDCCEKCAFDNMSSDTCNEAPCGSNGYFVLKGPVKVELPKTTNPREHSELIKAWADGAEIETFDRASQKWVDTPSPRWIKTIEYRVKVNEYPKTTLKRDRLIEIVRATPGTYAESYIAIANAAIEEFITSGEMQKYIEEKK